MFIESEILVDVLLRLIDVGVTALPVHDAIIVPESKAAMAKETMLSVFRARTGVEGVVEEESWNGVVGYPTSHTARAATPTTSTTPTAIAATTTITATTATSLTGTSATATTEREDC
jgi:hypothetical protein